MTIQDLFDLLLFERRIIVQVPDAVAAENLRIQLAKKWSSYKSSMDACGFLAEDLAACSLCRGEPESYECGAVFELRPRKQQKVEYTIVTTVKADGNATV